jgi:hypothetical protein
MGRVSALIIQHGLIFGGAATAYLFLLMFTLSPRVWGYADYPQAVKDKVPPQTKREKLIALAVGAPWLLFVLIYPVASTFMIKAALGSDIPLRVAILNPAVCFALLTFGDLVIVDWLFISKLTPKRVMIPGTVAEDYKDFSHHFRSHAKSAVFMALICVGIGLVASLT